MKKETLTERTQDLINSAIGVATINVNELIACGVINIEDFDDDYILPKIVATLILSNASKQTLPFDENARKVIENIKKNYTSF